MRATGLPEVGTVGRGMPVPPGTGGGAEVRLPEEEDDEDGVEEEDEDGRLEVEAFGSILRIESPIERSVSREVWAVAFVLAPTLSAAEAACSAELRAVLMALSACCMATWPNTPALPLVALKFSLLATLPRTWSPRPVILPPRFSTASGSIRVPRPPPPGVDGVEGVDGECEGDGEWLLPPWWDDEPRWRPVIGRRGCSGALALSPQRMLAVGQDATSRLAVRTEPRMSGLDARPEKSPNETSVKFRFGLTEKREWLPHAPR